MINILLISELETAYTQSILNITKVTFAYLLQYNKCVYIDATEFDIEYQYILNISQTETEYTENC